jgi:hypothetical protein
VRELEEKKADPKKAIAHLQWLLKGRSNEIEGGYFSV